MLMTKINRKYLIYAILLHMVVGLSFFLFDNESQIKENKNDTKVIEVDISAPSKNYEKNSIQAETFDESALEKEIEAISSLHNDFSRNNQLQDAEEKERIKEIKAIEHNNNQTKQKLIDERKKAQREKARAEKLEQEKKRLEKELKEMQEKKKIAKAKKELEEKKNIERNKKLEEDRKQNERKRQAELEKNEKKKNALTKEEWLNTPEGNSEYVQYTGMLIYKVKNNWIRPINSESGSYCKVEIKQDKQGRIENIKINECDPNDNIFKNSVRTSILQASPLPIPNDLRLFSNTIKFTFRVD